MKSKLYILLIILLMILIPSSIILADREKVTMFSMDGRTVDVYVSEVEAYRNVGWYKTFEEVTQTVYAEDGRTLLIYKAELAAYKNVGWYETIDDVMQSVYSMDGRVMKIYKAELAAYKNVGWYESLDEVTQKMYAKDGRTLIVFKGEVESYINVGWYLSPDCIDPCKPMLALTFDDGPNNNTKTILDTLEKYNVRATFFVLGSRVDTYANTLKRAVNLGMEIGCHTFSHANLTSLDSNSISAQISNTNAKIKSVTGVSPALVRPPYGAYNQTVRSAVHAPLVLWSLDTLDWKTRNAVSTVNIVLNNVRDGDIILMHDIHQPTAEAVQTLVPALLERGYQLVTVSELGYYRCGGMGSGRTYSAMRP